MREAAIALALMLGVQLLVPLAGAAVSPGAAEQAFVDLKLSVLADREPERDPVERLQEEVLAGGDHPPIVEAWQQAQNASGPAARQAVAEAEAALFELARERSRTALEGGNASRALDWLAVPLERAGAENRTMPALADGELDEERRREALDAALAVRARELVWKAFLLNATGQAAEAEATARGAQSIVELLVPDASRRLPDGDRELFEGDAIRVAQTVVGVPPDEGRYLFAGLAAGLTALQYDHDIEELEVMGQRPIDGVFVATRATREDPGAYEELAQAAYDRYRVDRGRLGLMGEGTNDELDRAYLAFRDALDAGDFAAARNATDRIHDAASELALLGQGAVVTVESGGVRPNFTHRYDVSLVRPSLDGVGSYRLELGYDGDVLDVVNVTPVAGDGELDWEGGGTTGAVAVELANTTPLREAAHLFQLHLEAAGPPDSQTNITVDEVDIYEPDGDRLDLFLTRDGNITVAEIRTDGDSPAEETATGGTDEATREDRSTSSLGLAGLLAATLLALAAGRTRR